jgi:hypothetical protein
MLFIGFSFISLVIASNSGRKLETGNLEQPLCTCPRAEIYPNSTLQRLAFCAYELGAACRPLQLMHYCSGPSAVATRRMNDCSKRNMFCTIADHDHRERSCGGYRRCKAENMDCGRNRSANPGFIYLNYGK